mgnify:CR=1 FL=1
MKLLNEILGTKYPIIQGGMANIATGEFAAACSNAGALGLIGAGGMNADTLRQNIRRCKELTDKPFGVNIMLMHPQADEFAKIVVEEGVQVVTTGAGNPGKYVPMWKAAGIKVIPVVAAAVLAKHLEPLGIDAVIAEGTESGGHVGETTTMALVPQVVDAVKIPVLAAGGIGDGRGVAAALMLGAKGVQVGTRFLVATECTIHENYKQRVLKAKDIDTIVTGRRLGHPVRGLKSPVTRRMQDLEYSADFTAEEFEKMGVGAMRKAAREGALSEFGQDVLRRVERACSDGEGRAGDLTPLGAEQHYGIAERMFESYPEVFRGNARVDAQSTVVVRCVLSMAAFCDQLRRMNPELEITRTANNRTTRYLNFFSTAANPGPAPEYLNLLKSESWIEAEEGFRESRMHPERLMARLFAGGKVPADIDQRELMQQLWALAVNEQDTRSGITFRDLFTPDELYAVWECVNYRFYHQRGPGALNRGYALRYATALLEEIIARADSALVRGVPAADLRFGHDGNLMPLTCLMAFDGCTAEVSDPGLIADAWRDYRISPMAANIQMIFYRKEGTADILVRILHNEHEMYLPLASARPPYYKWDDLRAFYHRRIAEAKGTAAEPPSAGALQAPGA